MNARAEGWCASGSGLVTDVDATGSELHATAARRAAARAPCRQLWPRSWRQMDMQDAVSGAQLQRPVVMNAMDNEVEHYNQRSESAKLETQGEQEHK